MFSNEDVAFVDGPFLFIAGITDRLGHFEEDLQQNRHSQRFVASFNCGIVLGQLLAMLHQGTNRNVTGE